MTSQVPPRSVRWLMRVNTVDEMWRKMLVEGDPMVKTLRHFWGLIPSDPRCVACNNPFAGIGRVLARIIGKGGRPSPKNPRYCTVCDWFSGEYPGGAEVTLTMLFADIRGSTALAEKMNAAEFSRLLNRFYAATTDVLVKADAFIDKFVGDEVVALFIPGYAGPQHARRGVEAAQELLRVTGHGRPEGPWLPVGVGVHTGVAYVGTVAGASGAGADFTALGDNVNVAARLASKASAGEVLVSEATCQAAGLDGGDKRDLELKGKSDTVSVRVLRCA